MFDLDSFAEYCNEWITKIENDEVQVCDVPKDVRASIAMGGIMGFMDDLIEKFEKDDCADKESREKEIERLKLDATEIMFYASMKSSPVDSLKHIIASFRCCDYIEPIFSEDITNVEPLEPYLKRLKLMKQFGARRVSIWATICQECRIVELEDMCKLS